jgi:hypothetical protein
MKSEDNEAASPAENLTVSLLGLALVRLGDDKQVKVFFPNAPDHPFKLTISKFVGFDEIARSEFVLPVRSVVDFSPDSKGATGGMDQSVEEDSVNLGYLHEKEHNETLALSGDLDKYLGFLNLNGTTLFSEKMPNQKEFQIWDVIGGTKTLVGSKFLGNFLKANYSVKAKDAATISVRKPFAFDLTLPFHEAGVRYEVTFSNDCEGVGCTEISDVKYFYEIIDVQRLKGTFEFTLPPVKDKAPNGSCSPGTGGRFAIPPEIDDYFSPDKKGKK